MPIFCCLTYLNLKGCNVAYSHILKVASCLNVVVIQDNWKRSE